MYKNKQNRFPGINLISVSWSHFEVTKGSSKCENWYFFFYVLFFHISSVHRLWKLNGVVKMYEKGSKYAIFTFFLNSEFNRNKDSVRWYGIPVDVNVDKSSL